MTIESASPRPTLRQRVSLYPGQFIGAMVMVSLGPLLDPLMRDLDVPLSRGGVISALFFVGGVLGILVVNCVMAKVSVTRTIVTGMALQGVGLVAGSTAQDLWTLLPALFVAGLGGVFVNTICWIWLPAHVKENMAAAALLMISFFALGMIVTPVVLGIVMDAGATWRWILVAEGGVSLLAASFFAVFPLLDVTGRQNIRPQQLSRVVNHNRGLLLAIVVAIFMYTGAETSFNVWLPKFQIDVFGASDAWASLSVTLFWIGIIAGRLIMVPLTKRFSPSRLLLVCAAILAVMAVGVALAPTLATSMIFSVGAGLGASAAYGLIGSYAGHFPGWYSGVVSSLFVLGGSFGCALFPYIFGPLASAGGFRFALAAVALPALAFGALSFLIHSRSQEREPSG